VALDDHLIFPANKELVLIAPSGEDVKSLPVAGGSSMSPAVWGGKAVLADKKGSLLVIDPTDGSVLSSIPTTAVQSVAQSPSVFDDKAVFCSRKGIVAAVDLKNGTVLWERKLDRTVFADVITTDEGCFVYTTKKELFALSWASGEDLYAPLKAVSSLPGYEDGRFILTDQAGVLKLINAGTGALVKRYNLNEPFTARPIVRDGIIIAVGKSGQFYRIDTEGMTE
jgi:outer membrane protein assembly factor BamB